MSDFKRTNTSTRYVKSRPMPKTKNAKQAINDDDARGFRKRKAKAKRIKGETKAKPKGAARNPGDLGKWIGSMQRKKPY